MIPTKKEHRLQHDCFVWAQNEFARLGRLLIFAIPNEIRHHPGLLPGAADLCLIAAGRVLFIELKVGRNDQSPAQITFEARAKDQGADYVVIRSLDEFQAIVKGWVDLPKT
jgi:hypothetical protein